MSSVALRIAKIPNFIDFFALEVLLFGIGFTCTIPSNTLLDVAKQGGLLQRGGLLQGIPLMRPTTIPSTRRVSKKSQKITQLR